MSGIQFVPNPEAGTLVSSTEEFQNALKTAGDGDVITMTQNIELTASIRALSENITLDAKGHTISGVPMYITGNNVTVKNAVFDNAKKEKESCVYT